MIILCEIFQNTVSGTVWEQGVHSVPKDRSAKWVSWLFSLIMGWLVLIYLIYSQLNCATQKELLFANIVERFFLFYIEKDFISIWFWKRCFSQFYYVLEKLSKDIVFICLGTLSRDNIFTLGIMWKAFSILFWKKISICFRKG